MALPGKFARLGPPGPQIATAVPATSVLVIDGDPNDFVGNGQEVTYQGADATITTHTLPLNSAAPNQVQLLWQPNPFTTDWSWTLTFAAALGQPLVVGTYQGAVSPVDRTGSQPGIDIGGNGRGCEAGGAFTVEQISFDPNGVLLSFAATFRQDCGGSLYGEVRYNSTVGYATKTFSPTSVAFGSVPVGVTAPGQTVTVTSSGSVPLVITKSSFTTVPNPSSFAVTGGTCVSNAADVTVNPGSSCTFSVTTDTSTVITPTAISAFADNSARAAGKVPLSATFTGAAVLNTNITRPITGRGGGSVTSSPSGISCLLPSGFGGLGGTCQALFVPGTHITLTATPDSISAFTGWDAGGCPGTGTCSFTATAGTTTVTAHVERSVVNVGRIGNGTGQITSPAGFSCQVPAQTGTCELILTPGTSLTLTAAAAAGSVFDGWGGVACPGTGTCTFSAAPGITNVTADLETAGVGVTGSGGGTGSVASSPSGISCAYSAGACTGTTSMTVVPGTMVTLTATPAAGSLFAGWGPPCSGTGSCTFAAPAATTTVSARFERAGPALGTTAGTAHLTAPTTFAGRTDFTGGACTGTPCLEPPDPWLAVGPSHVVQTTNASVRISTKTGTLLNEVALASFFAEIGAQDVDGDPRIVWDALHSRWVGVEMSADCSAGYLYLAVSNSADPTSTWTVYAFTAAGLLFDYPTLGISSDKVAISFNLYGISCAGGFGAQGFAGADFIVVDAATLVAHPASLPYADRGADGSVFTWRPALGLKAGNDLPFVVGVVNGPVLDVGYARLTGTMAASTLAVTTTADLTTSLGLPAFSDPPTPIAFGPQAVPPMDGRPTDAIISGGQLWFVSGTGCVPAGDTRARACIRLTALASGPIPTKLQDFTVGRSGFDVFEGAIGMTAQQSLAVVWSESSATSRGPISTVASYRLPADPAGQLRPETSVAAGAGTYAGRRWGDFVGVAMDPSDPRAVWEADEVSTASGDWRTQVTKLSIDPGPYGTASINGGAATATSSNVTLTLSVSDDLAAVSTLRISNDPGMAGAVSMAPTTSTPWTLLGGDGIRTVYVQWTDALGDLSPIASDSVVVDTLAPTVSGLTLGLNAGTTMGTTASVRLSWTGADAGSGISKYEVWLSTNGGSYVLVSSPTSPAYSRSLTLSSTTTYRYRVRAFDKVGHVSGFVYTATFHVKLLQQTSSLVHYGGTWSLSTTTSASGGSYRYTSTAGRYVTYTFTGRAIGVVAYRSTALGSFSVYVDGVFVGNGSDYATSTQWKRIAYSRNVTSGTHTIKLVCLATSGHPRIDLDAFIVIG